MTTSSTSTDWIREGAEVAEYDDSGYDKRVTLTTIAKLTKTQIVLANDTRYSRDSRRGMGGNRKELMPADDPRVLRVQDREAITGLFSKADNLYRDLRNQRVDMYAALDAIEQAVREARAAITGKEA